MLDHYKIQERGMIMETKSRVMIAAAMVLLCGAAGLAETVQAVTLTAEVNQSMLAAGQMQTVYLRVGLKGCPMYHTCRCREPINLAIVIDKSGSMSSDRKMDKAKEAALLALERLNSDDILSVVAYDNSVEVLVPATRLTDKDYVREKIRQLNAGGSTALHAGVEKGGKELQKFLSKEKVNRMMLLSDGLANVGPSSTEEVGRLGSRLAEKGISITTIGLGLGYNEDLMSQLAYVSDGGHYFVERASQLAEIFEQDLSRSMSVVAQKAQIEIICGEGMRPVRILGREGRIDGRTVYLDIQNIYADHEKFILVEVEIPAHAAGRVREAGMVRAAYLDMNTNTTQKITGSADVRFCESNAEAERSINKRVMADVVEMLAVERNKLAMQMRDAGKTDEAKKMLGMNAAYLQKAAKDYDRPALDGYATENAVQAEQLDEANWNRSRKQMVEGQSARQSQR